MRDILQGKVLNVEGVVDVLTLKDNEDSIDDYATALHLLARAEVNSPVSCPFSEMLNLSMLFRTLQMFADYRHSEGLGVECTTMTSMFSTVFLFACTNTTVQLECHPPNGQRDRCAAKSPLLCDRIVPHAHSHSAHNCLSFSK